MARVLSFAAVSIQPRTIISTEQQQTIAGLVDDLTILILRRPIVFRAVAAWIHRLARHTRTSRAQNPVNQTVGG